MTLKYDASTQAEALENITCQLTAEQHAHTATSEELADLLGSSSQDRKAWKADRAMLMCERDGAISQVLLSVNLCICCLDAVAFCPFHYSLGRCEMLSNPPGAAPIYCASVFHYQSHEHVRRVYKPELIRYVEPTSGLC